MTWAYGFRDDGSQYGSQFGLTGMTDGDSLFIARTAEDTYEVGHYDNDDTNGNGAGDRVVRRTFTVDPLLDDNDASAVGFWTDVRAVGTLGTMDDLRTQEFEITSMDQVVDGIVTTTIDGDFTLDTGSMLALDLFSTTTHDQLAVTGSAILSGMLDIALDATASLTVGDMFTVLTTDTGTISGAPSLGGSDGSLFSISASSTSTALILEFTGAGGLSGDYNNDGVVDAADYAVWRDNLGLDDSALNGNGTGDASGNVVQADYTLWRDNYGSTSAPSAGLEAAATPEPAAAVLLMLGASALLASRRR